MVKLVNRAKMTTATTGTGTITLGSASDGYQTFAAAGVSDGDTVRYTIEDGNAFEIGSGVYTASGTTLSRTVSESSNSNNALNLSGNAVVFVTAASEDFGNTVTAVASGTLANGDTVIVNSNGTVSAVSGTASTSIGSQVQMAGNEYSKYGCGGVYDTANNKVVYCYCDGNNSFYGTAVVGTVSGSSISFGTPVVFYSGSLLTTEFGNNVIFHTSLGKIIVTFTSSTVAYQVIGTVSGTSISFSSAQQPFGSSTCYSVSACYDSGSSKIVVAGRDGSDSNRLRALVGTVSSSSISYGSSVRLSTALSRKPKLASNGSGTIVCLYASTGNYYAYATAMTISGTTVTAGSTTQIGSSNNSFNRMSIVYCPNVSRWLTAYRHSSRGHLSLLSVSGTTITTEDTLQIPDNDNAEYGVLCYNDGVSTPYYFYALNAAVKMRKITVTSSSISAASREDVAASLSYIASPVYDPDTQQFAVSTTSSESNGASNVQMVNVNNITTNLTAENYIGIADAAYANGDTATVQIVGSVDDAQSSLTAGQQYYVQATGGVGLTASNPSVLAGTAVSATKLIVKG